MRMQDGPRWFDRGLFDIRIEAKTDGQKYEFSYESDQPERGSMSGPNVAIPKRFEHLITPEMLKPVPVNL
jgi:hypothetical protein